MTPGDLSEPGLLTIGTDGTMNGRTGGYDKAFGDLRGVYHDEAAYGEALRERGSDSLAYRVEEHRNAAGPGALIIGTSTLLPARVGAEFALTRGHLHAKSDRAELYHCLSGHGVLLLESLSGESRAIAITPGQAVHVPGEWVHRSVNVGTEPFVTLFCYAADAGQDYGLIADAGGMAQLVVCDPDGGWTTRPNPRHTGYRRRP
ncbi:glucose-6-phosphate isomerase family protein [Dactylosporangium sp. CA-092794]|uniref:glucose-6-phosphate isomerase family protein n=1 Tax=Dactylosporangium sp. CA-092794 TaxID=3239929 RepID=UPI003D943004